ncbi:hypothetical protein [Ferroacidibacillus organovorans]|uniref:Uncharacterized protein n=1 Tax=Ferroacidibacillus organovorans TaxID=1765683 RepID=A0A162TJB4_9BACL|nr:hypothetical protein [Ferroacidibacillus organovorans]KYP80863.1 hypothetical protein AYJ22_01525 [Ferroacidibacillus organovorans]OAG95408.1 hypothetical protein AYW79_00405 [Ferroacidibacillus organovorans]OPG15755.1 hypothetical protein B2M26_09035 [Ferroacidibacillus organovorans]
MAAFISVGSIQTAAMTNATGQFFGQNVQNDWDAHAVTAMAAALCMGDFAYVRTSGAWLSMRANVIQPIYDQDVKGNGAYVIQR